MKRSSLSGSTTLTLPASGSTVTHTVSHNLGYVPFFIVGSHINDSSTIWSGNMVHKYRQTSAFPGDVPVQLSYWCTDTTLTINLRNGTGSGDQQGGLRTVYWIIYLDYENA